MIIYQGILVKYVWTKANITRRKAKFTDQLSFPNRFLKSGQTYRKYRGEYQYERQSVAEPETLVI